MWFRGPEDEVGSGLGLPQPSLARASRRTLLGFSALYHVSESSQPQVSHETPQASSAVTPSSSSFLQYLCGFLETQSQSLLDLPL